MYIKMKNSKILAPISPQFVRLEKKGKGKKRCMQNFSLNGQLRGELKKKS